MLRDNPVTRLLIPLLLLGLSPSAGRAEWLRISRGEVEFFSDASPARATAVLLALEDAQTMLNAAFRSVPDSAPPLRVLHFQSRSRFEAFRAGDSLLGFYQSAGERDYVLLAEAGERTFLSARHELVHRLLHRSFGPSPQWLDEGLAEYYSTLERRGAQAVAGRPHPHHVETLARREWLDASDLFAVRSTAQFDGQPGRRTVFYAQSWALVHLLLTRAGNNGGIQNFLDGLWRGESQNEAFQRAFGFSPKQALQELRSYVGPNRNFATRVFDVPAPAGTPVQTAAVSESEMNGIRAEAHLALDQIDEARRLLGALPAAPAQGPPAARQAVRAGLLALRLRDFGRAEAELKRALALDSRDPSAWFEYAMLVRETGGPAAEIEKCLKKTLELAPAYAEAWYFLAALAEERNAPAEARSHLENALKILPRQSAFWEALARLQWKAGDLALARTSARKALDSARDANEAALARGLSRQLETAPPPAKKTAAAAPPGPAQPRTLTLAGLLGHIDCRDDGLYFHIDAERRWTLYAPGPGSVKLDATESSRRFACGPQAPPLRIEAEYEPGGGPSHAAGRLLRLLIRP